MPPPVVGVPVAIKPAVGKLPNPALATSPCVRLPIPICFVASPPIFSTITSPRPTCAGLTVT